MADRPLHVDPAFQAQLDALRQVLVEMGDRVEAMARDAVGALLNHDLAAAERVVAEDDVVDGLELDTDALCMRILARHAPVGEDLRLVTCALKVVTDLERVGDLATSIAKSVPRLPPDIGGTVRSDIERLADRAIGELHKATRALAERHSETARALAIEDDLVDELNRRAFDRVVELAEKDPARLGEALVLSAVCRHLERIGDHAVNIGEMVVYFLDGDVLRHATVEQRLR